MTSTLTQPLKLTPEMLQKRLIEEMTNRNLCKYKKIQKGIKRI